MTKEQENEKHDIGLELIKWLPLDKAYTYTLSVYAFQNGLITEAEAQTVKMELDAYYSNENTTKINKNKHMLNIFTKIGFSKTKVLWRLIDQFPSRVVGDPINCEFYPDNESVIKKTDIPSISYFEIIEDLIKYGYLSKRMDKKKMLYTIHFDVIMEDSIDAESKLEAQK